MMIHRVTQCSNVSFAAGKTKLVTDMGGTLQPFSEEKILNPYNTELDGAFNKFYSQFRALCKKAGDKFHLTITTSQSKQDFDSFLTKTLKKRLNFLLPEKLITKDGTFLRVSPREFHQSETKVAQVTAASGWVKSQVFNDLKPIINSINPKISVLEHQGEKLPEDFLKNQKDNNYIVLQKDDLDFEVRLFLPKDAESRNLMKKLGEHFEDKAINIEVKKRCSEKLKLLVFKDNGTVELESSHVITLQPKFDEDNPLSKLYDTRKQVLQNIEENNHDLVIVAGDSINDAAMLNPFSYLKIPRKAMDDSAYKEWLSDKNVLKELREMPFVSIVVGNDPWLDPIREIGKMLDEKGIHKVITIDKPDEELLPAIKQAMRNYAQENPEYKNDLGKELSKEILGKEALPPPYFIQLLIEYKKPVETHK